MIDYFTTFHLFRAERTPGAVAVSGRTGESGREQISPGAPPTNSILFGNQFGILHLSAWHLWCDVGNLIICQEYQRPYINTQAANTIGVLVC